MAIQIMRYKRPGYNPIELDNLRPYLRKEKIKKIYGNLGKSLSRDKNLDK